MDNRSFQDARGILWFGSISFGIVLCALVVWVYILHESSVERIDQTLQHEVQTIGVLIKVLAVRDTVPSALTTEIIRQVCSDLRDISLEIYDTKGTRYLETGFIDSAFSLYSLGCSLLLRPITVLSKNNSAYRAYGQTFDGYQVYGAVPVPTLWNLLENHDASPSIMFPILILFLAVVGIWSFIRLHRPIQRLDYYLRTLIQQPIGNELPKPPLSPKGDVYQLTQTVLKIVERLHISRNQALQFSSFASHELRTPLSIIRSQLESALASRSRSRELRSVVASAYDEMLRLNRTVDDLLSLGTMQAGTLALNLETISLPKFLNDFYDEALFLSRPKNISVVLKKGSDVYLKVDVIRLRQVFFNLLDNAIKNTPSGNRIRLSYSIKDHLVVIVFSDTGIGIAPDKLMRIFEPFFTDAQKSEHSQGAGLGLALVKWIIELHRGNITVHSEINKGTEFIIALPYERVLEKP